MALLSYDAAAYDCRCGATDLTQDLLDNLPQRNYGCAIDTDRTAQLENRLRSLVAERDQVQTEADRKQAEIAAVVAELRAAGDTWTRIGELLGITRQGAVKRYGGHK